MQSATLVVPCYNEETRVDGERFLALARAPGISLLFVNDGSTDGTGRVLADLESRGEGFVRVLSLAKNRGKAEAVRQGMLSVLDGGRASAVGYADCDLATPPEELVRLVSALEDPRADVILAARVGLAGTRIERKRWRHMTGRVFAVAASLILNERFYDTQCGAKVFRATGLLRAALSEPFHSRWAFDVELIGRLLAGAGGHPGLPATAFSEVPLHEWVDVQGSKLNVASMARTVFDLAVIARELRQRRGGPKTPA